MPSAVPSVVPSEALVTRWLRTKSLAAPTALVRKGMSAEATVDAQTGASFQNIHFERDSALLLPGITQVQLAEVARAMETAASERFVIEGHTCDLGSDTHNAALSQRRALAVKDALCALGVAPERLLVLGMGSTDPAAPNLDESLRARNRRVQVFRRL